MRHKDDVEAMHLNAASAAGEMGMSSYTRIVIKRRRLAWLHSRRLRELGAAIAELVAYAVMAFAVGFALVASLAS